MNTYNAQQGFEPALRRWTSRPGLTLFLGLLLLTLCNLLSRPARAAETPETQAKQIWQLLDYVAVDYGGAVAKKTVINAAEYAEMNEFAAAAERQLSALPASPRKAELQRQAGELRQAVTSKAEPAAVAQQAHKLADALQAAYPFPTAPAAMPDLARGAQLFQAQCASCHGSQGNGDGALAAKLEPKPIAFTDHARARERSLFALHQVITNGVPGTSMQSYKTLPDADRWALAAFVGTLAYSEQDQAAGEKLWQTDAKARQALVSLAALTQTSEQALSERLDAPAAKALTAYLRTHPQAITANSSGGLALARTRLSESLTAVNSGDRAKASQLALSAYLDGFEPVEPMLALRNQALFSQLESGMVAYRALVAQGSPAEVQAAQQKLQGLLNEADRALAPAKGDATATFIGALTILLREGVEALLVVVGMLAFLKKAGRRDLLGYVHAGWVSALTAGGLTWGAATYLVAISGASRELTEGFSALFAAGVLFAVGIWMHQKSVAGRWQLYLKDKLSSALGKRTAWFLFSLAFVAVYREVFETVLFYAALWTEGSSGPLLAGLGTGIVLLAGLALILLRTSARLPIGQFFAVSSLLVSILAVVLTGKGIAALQEAGMLPISPVPLPRIELLGLYPTLQTLSAQLCVLLAIVFAVILNQRSGRRLAADTSESSTPNLERTSP